MPAFLTPIITLALVMASGLALIKFYEIRERKRVERERSKWPQAFKKDFKSCVTEDFYHDN
jgi:hypothetical protein